MANPEVIIVGGGIAGLAAAYELHRLRVPFLLLESSARVGGVVLTEQIDGFTIDAGPEALLVQKPDAITLCEELGLGERLVATKLPRVAFIQRGGRLHPLPAASVLGIPTRLGPFIRTRLFSWSGKARMGFEMFVPPRRDDADESIGSFMLRRFGAEATEFLAEPLLAGIHAGNVDRLSVRSLFPRFVEAERTHGSLLRAFRRPAADPATGPAGTMRRAQGPFLSLPDGLSEMIRALVAALPASSIRLQSPAARILARSRTGRDEDPSETPLFRLQLASGEILSARSIVLAAPAYVAGRLLRDVDATLATACESVPYASSATIALAFPRTAVRHPLRGSGFVVPRSEGTGILAASWLSSKWPHRSPDDRVLLRAFVGGARDPEALDRSDADLVLRARTALDSLLGISGEALLTRVYRWDRSNAQHEVGHLAGMAAIERRIGSHPGLFVTGSGFRGVGIPDCIADGRATARQAADWLAAFEHLSRRVSQA
jgi:oxygen-dependent protoporphyrinogen oxidase